MSEHYYTARPTAPSRPEEVTASLRGLSLSFVTDAAVFSRGKVDKGTRLLIERLPLPVDGDALDLGCGYGPVGLVIAGLSPKARVWLIDVNERAVALAAANARRNGIDNVTVQAGDGFAPVEGRQFRLIASNPPIRAGKEVIYPWVEQAYDHLVPGGRVVFVIRTSHGAKSLARKIEEVFGRSDELGKGSGFRVLSGVKVDSSPAPEHIL